MSPRIAILTMQKDDSRVLEPFLKYHEDLVGSSSIFLFDNGSRNRRVLATLAAAERRGVHVERRHSSRQDFANKGEILTQFIHHLEATNPFDFYFPLDCDEFLASLSDEEISCSRHSLERALAPFRNEPGTLVISHKYWANPLLRNHYRRITASRKCFFAHGSCGQLDHGFHQARSRSGAPDRTTPIVYFEFHYRPYSGHRQQSRDKLLAFHPYLQRRCLRDYVTQRVVSHHCAADLLQSKFSYLAQFTPADYPIIDHQLLDGLTALGVDTRMLFERVPPVGRTLWQRWLRLRAALVTMASALSDGITDGFRAAPYWLASVRRRLGGR